jgi:elongation factor Ts
MAEISAALVKELRTKSGAGMMDCKKALAESGGDMDAAVDWLRTKGLAAAQKKSARVAAEGLIGLHAGEKAALLIEVNSETDFVARNEQFQEFVTALAELAHNVEGDLDRLLATGFPGTDRAVSEELTQRIATIGENMNIRRAAYLEVPEGVVASYIHNAVADGLGKIGVLVALQSAGDREKLSELGRQIAMHVAAAAPQALDVESLDPELVEREREVLVSQARESGKPENIIEKMIEGRIRKYYEEVVLLKQVWVLDGESRVEDVVKAKAKELGTDIKVTGFVRFQLGEGIEKKEEDFAAEVAQTAGR